ncbi:hypothetical protein Vadar_023153 [Vaccinium darrowii]|uniref:Uncharacterized protein n=1 Tax=Vaccinium darrowii TaxID=229202 RepID=A0ACB7Z712_9ERIC|nr:hypothetical protein Vadar_023153 [Vaccinium darrowii]
MEESFELDDLHNPNNDMEGLEIDDFEVDDLHNPNNNVEGLEASSIGMSFETIEEARKYYEDYGSNLLATGNCLYSNVVVYLNRDVGYGGFFLTHDDMKIPKSRKIYSFNEGNCIGCLVRGIHRILMYGGIYGQNGNLRLLYECAPRSNRWPSANTRNQTRTGTSFLHFLFRINSTRDHFSEIESSNLKQELDQGIKLDIDPKE